MITVFLGGTCNGSSWRPALLNMLHLDKVSAFNPVVADWTPECQAEEIRQREISDYCLYVITPKMTGVYSIAEAVDDSNKRGFQTLFCTLPADDGHIFTTPQLKSLGQVAKMIDANGGHCFGTLEEVAAFLNKPVAQVPAPVVAGYTSQGIDFGHALAALKSGQRVARQGWNGKGMFIFMRPGDTLPNDFLPKVKSLPESVKTFLLSIPSAPGGGTEFTPYLCMYAADGSIVNGWLASQSDMLSSDWVILD